MNSMKRTNQRGSGKTGTGGNRRGQILLPGALSSNRRSNAMVEFSLVFLLFLSWMFGTFTLCFWVFTKAILHSAVREGVRYAVTGRTQTGMGQDDSIKQVIKTAALGFLNDPANDDKIVIQYYAADGSATDANDPGNLVMVSVEGYPVGSVVPNPLFALGNPITVTVRAVDKMEPFPTAPVRQLPPPP